jgi:UDP-N-acetylglucosamine:LPS N-acetylglucosamine transferase
MEITTSEARPLLTSRSPRTKVLFFSRGRGRGHALPDIEIARELRRIRPDVDLHFASYATGAETLVRAGLPTTDLDLGEDAKFLEVLVRATRLIFTRQPDLVISHEEFAALPAARSVGVGATFIVDFFVPIDVFTESLALADQVFFIEQRGIFTEPPAVRGKVHYVGPIVRQMTLTRADRAAARNELGLPATSTVVSVIPGAWATEQRAPIVDLVLPAFQRLAGEDNKLVWIAGRDHEALASRLAGQPGVMVMKECSPIEKLMVASDLVITKANRGTTIDLASLGVPSLSLSFGLNPIDETIIPRIHSNLALNARGIDVPYLAQVMAGILRPEHRSSVHPSREYAPGGAVALARALAAIVGR